MARIFNSREDKKLAIIFRASTVKLYKTYSPHTNYCSFLTHPIQIKIPPKPQILKKHLTWVTAFHKLCEQAYSEATEPGLVKLTSRDFKR